MLSQSTRNEADVDQVMTPERFFRILPRVCRRRGQLYTCKSQAHDSSDCYCELTGRTIQEYRDDEGEFPRSALGNQIEGAEGEEWWININDEVRRSLRSRLSMTKVIATLRLAEEKKTFRLPGRATQDFRVNLKEMGDGMT